MAVQKNLEIVKKSTKTYELQFTKNGTAEDITGWTIYFTAKEEMSDSDSAAVISKKITTHTDAVNGKSTIELEATDTDLDERSFWYAIDYKDDEGNESVLFYGRLTILKSVRHTRD